MSLRLGGECCGRKLTSVKEPSPTNRLSGCHGVVAAKRRCVGRYEVVSDFPNHSALPCEAGKSGFRAAVNCFARVGGSKLVAQEMIGGRSDPECGEVNQTWTAPMSTGHDLGCMDTCFNPDNRVHTFWVYL